MKDKQLLDRASKNLPDDNFIKLMFSKGWIELFKKRYELHFRRLYSASMVVDINMI